jgi:hypothetical protein
MYTRRHTGVVSYSRAVLVPAPFRTLLTLGVALGASLVLAPTSLAAEQRGPLEGRLEGLRAEALALLEQARGVDGAARRAALASAAERVGALAEAGGAASPLPEALREELRGAASQLAELAASAGTGAGSLAGPVALLERVRARLRGEIALGLGFEGSFSQAKLEEPAYGGHASSMGPAPADVPAPEVSSPVRFEESARLAAQAWCGGPGKDHILESGGSGLALFDYDGDGRLDIYVITAAELTPSRARVPHRNALYRNLGGWRFEDVSERAGVDAAAWGNGACAGDYDGDGRLDLYVTNWGANLLFRNRGDGTLEERAEHAGVQVGGWSTGCAFLDADADGDLDLYVARYVETTWDDVVAAERTLQWRGGPRIMVGPVGLTGQGDRFFDNQGDGTFAEVTAERGLADSAGAYGFGVVATDFDGDGWVDLFVANDSNPNFLYRNLGGGRFESVGLLSGVAVDPSGRSQAGMGVEAGDYDGDGRLDLFVTNFAHDSNALYRNLGGEVFEDATAAAELAAASFGPMGWGVAFLDADLDGRLDLFVANGHIFPDVGDFPELGESYAQPNQLFLGEGERFRDVSAAAGAGLAVQRSSRGLAVGDLDDDGDLDVVVSNVDGAPTLLRNDQRTGHHWVGFRLESPGPNRFAIGARVSLSAGGRVQVREVRSGGSYLSQSDLRVYFGLGGYGGPVDVEVRMPGGARWRFEALPADSLHVLRLAGPGEPG